MCIDWILLACLHLQMEACVLFYPEKATGFCVCQHIKKGDCVFIVAKLYKIKKMYTYKSSNLGRYRNP